MIILKNLVVTSSGIYDAGSCQSSEVSYKIDGNFAGGYVEVGYITGDGSFVKYVDVPPVSSSNQAVIRCGQGSSVAYKVVAPSATLLYIVSNVVA